MTTLEFTMHFHAPVLRATGFAAEGYDASVDPSRPLAGEALKGLMRAAATHVLELPPSRVATAFEPQESGARWRWVVREHLFVDPGSQTGTLHRVKIDPETHTAIPDHLLRARTARVKECRFAVNWLGKADAAGVEDSALLLKASAGAVHSVGGQRRRGLGWVGVDVVLSDAEITRLLEWRNA